VAQNATAVERGICGKLLLSVFNICVNQQAGVGIQFHTHFAKKKKNTTNENRN